MTFRTPPYHDRHRDTSERTRDRVKYRPGIRALLRWAATEYAREVPVGG
jgi:hypothetical protein